MSIAAEVARLHNELIGLEHKQHALRMRIQRAKQYLVALSQVNDTADVCRLVRELRDACSPPLPWETIARICDLKDRHRARWLYEYPKRRKRKQ